ncbi:ATP-grasp domain-containing protein [Candidatus Saccharibacteria bacterium]|nr:ATP-grasp domain-containing protein [Candidatus Saccharibacteria bacterium]
MSRIAIVGMTFSGLKNKIKELGYEYTVLRDVRLQNKTNVNYKYTVWVDFSTKETIIRSLGATNEKFDAIVCAYENYVLPAALIAEFYGLPGLPVAAAEACTDKYIMRSLFYKASRKISPEFEVVSDVDSTISFANNHSFPVILKPANLAKSLLVTKNHDLSELTENYTKSSKLLSGIYKKYAANRKPKMIIEEFMEGSVHSVDAFVDSNGTPHVLESIVDYQTGYDMGFDDNFHYSRLLPSTLKDNEKHDLIDCAEIGIKALGIKNSAAHVEIIMTTNGPRIVEIGARNGGYRERMHQLSNGVDVYTQTLRLSMGEKPDTRIFRNEPCAVLELFPKQAGVFAGLHNEQKLRSLSSLSYISIKPEIGDLVGKSADGYKMCAVIVLHNNNEEIFKHDLDFINKHVYVKTN